MSYRVQSIDTSPEVEKLQLAILRGKGEAGRTRLLRSLTATTRRLSWHNLCQIRPDLDRAKAFYYFLKLTYGDNLATQVQVDFERRSQAGKAVPEGQFMISEDILEAITPVIDTFEALKVPYLIAGSLASSTHGLARSTADADLVADLRAGQVTAFIARLEPDYYVSRIAIEEALNRHASFNLLHLATGIKVDIFILKTDPFNRTSFSRARGVQLDKVNSRQFMVDAPEDVLLQKLKWYRAAGEVSERQWLDVLGILKIQANQLDRAYLAEWAERLGLSLLLERALDEAGLIERE